MARPRTGRWLRWPAGRLAFGADYNPEQWPREVWDSDVRLMGAAGVNVVTLAVFLLGAAGAGRGQWDFHWLDEVMDLLHAHHIGVDLARQRPPATLADVQAPGDPAGDPHRGDGVAGRPGSTGGRPHRCSGGTRWSW